MKNKMRSFTIAIGTLVACLICSFSGCENVNESAPTAAKSQPSSQPISLPSTYPPLVAQAEYSGTPRYCLIAIGPNREKKMWAVIDDQTMYVDLNANGDLSEEGEQFDGKVEMSYEGTTFINFFIGELEHDKLMHTDANVRAAIKDDGVKASISLFLDAMVASANNSHVLTLEMNADPAKASLVHFGGPISLGLYDEPQEVVAGKEMKFYALVGTPGDGKGTLTAIAHEDIPDDAHPKVDFEFPHRDPGQPNIELSTYLKKRC